MQESGNEKKKQNKTKQNKTKQEQEQQQNVFLPPFLSYNVIPKLKKRATLNQTTQ